MKQFEQPVVTTYDHEELVIETAFTGFDNSDPTHGEG